MRVLHDQICQFHLPSLTHPFILMNISPRSLPFVLACHGGVSLLRDVGREHLGELLVLQAAAQELVFRQVAVPVLREEGRID